MEVVSTSPTDASDTFDPGASIEITFSAEVAEASVTSSTLQLLANGTQIDATITLSGSVVKVQPKQRLALLGSYELSLAEGIASSQGAKLRATKTVSFKTRDGVWSEATPFQDDAKGSVENLRILPNARGGAVAVWTATTAEPVTTLYGSHCGSDHKWSTPRVLSDAGGSVTHYWPEAFDIAADGNALAAWVQNNEIRAARYVPDSGWQASDAVLGDANSTGGSVGALRFDASGAAVLVGLAPNGSALGAWAFHYIADGGWDEPKLLQNAYAPAASYPWVAVTPGGKALAVWKEAQSKPGIWSNVSDDGVSWGVAQQLTPPEAGASPFPPRASFISEDEAFVGWRFIADSGGGQRGVVAHHESGAWAKGSYLVLPTDSEVMEINTAADWLGNAFVVWNSTYNNDQWGSRYEPSEGWLPAEKLDATGAWQGNSNAIAFDALGNGFTVWGDFRKFTSVARRYVAGSGWKTTTAFDAGSENYGRNTELGVGRDGVTWFAWHADGAGYYAVFE
jgi:hypothetical protein